MRWFKPVSMIVVVSLCTFLLIPPTLAQSGNEEEGSTASRAGLGAASLLLTIPYGVTKLAFAVGGGAVGGLTYLFTGGNQEAAKQVWTSSMYGTYTITPDHLTGKKPVRFIGVPDEDNHLDDY